MQAAMMGSSMGVRPTKAFAGDVRGLQKIGKVSQRMTARTTTKASSAAMEEVPTPEKRVSSCIPHIELRCLFTVVTEQRPSNAKFECMLARLCTHANFQRLNV